MKKIDLLYGALIGLLTTFIGVFIYLKISTGLSFSEALEVMKSQGLLGKVITIGAVLNIVSFFTLLKFNKELMARGVVLATILLTVLTLLV